MADKRPVSVLVVEDDEVHRELVGDCLARQERRFDVAYAKSCGEAAQLLDSREFDCVVLDHNLPDGTGCDVLKKAGDRLAATPVVAFSTSADPDVALSEFRSGCIDFMSKRELFKNGGLANFILGAVEKNRTKAAMQQQACEASVAERAAALLQGSESKDSDQPADRMGLICRTAVQTTQDGVVLVQGRQRIAFANPAFRRLIGGSPCVLPGDPPLLIEEVLTTAAASAFRARETAAGQYESTLRGADGTPIPVLIGETPMGDQGVLLAVSDLRDVKARQAELEDKNKKLGELLETSTRFVDDVSHEFRTPLTVIKGYTELIQNTSAGPVTDQQREFVGIVLDRTRDLAQMVDDLLDTSKLRAGCLRVDRRSNTVAEVVAAVRSTIAQKAQTCRVRLREEFPEDLPRVYCDAEKTGRVVVNLVINAIKFSREGGEVVIGARRSKDGGVEVFVTDTGPGIAPQNLKVIFERFKQVGTGWERSSTKGFGLGLSIAKDLVSMNFGTIEVESELGRGSTFRFTIPPDDPRTVMRQFLRTAQAAPESGPMQLAMIAVRPHHAVDAGALRSVVSAHLFPMDLLFGADRGGLILVGLCAEPQKWASRLRSTLGATGGRSPVLPAVDFEVLGAWPHPGGAGQATDAICNALEGRDVKATPDHR